MATRSFIGIVNPDQTVTAIYCHYDGYPTGVGATLKTRWATSESVEALMALGDLSTLGLCIESTTAYHRDRGEELNIRRYPGTAELLKSASDAGVEYVYTWSDGQWQTTRL